MTVHCFKCNNDAYVEGKGVIYYRAKNEVGKWGSLPICLPCWRVTRGFEV